MSAELEDDAVLHQRNVRRIFASSYDEQLRHKERLVFVNPNVCYIVCLAKGTSYVVTPRVAQK